MIDLKNMPKVKPNEIKPNRLDDATIEMMQHPERFEFKNKYSMQNIQKTWIDVEMPIELFGRHIYKNELTFFFGDTSSGKSILAYQIANALSKGESVFDADDFENNEGIPITVLYLDSEMKAPQQKKRFNNTQFGNDFLCMNKKDFLNTYGRYDLDSVTDAIQKAGAELVILDNISAYLRDASQDYKEANRVMQEFEKMVMNMPVGIVVIAHTPKLGLGQPLTRESMSGAKSLVNLSDNQFGIGRVPGDKNQRYLKHLKPRNGEESELVNIIEIFGGDENDLHFDYVGEDTEDNVLGLEEGAEPVKRRDAVQEILMKEGKSLSFTDLKIHLINHGFKEGNAKVKIQRSAKKKCIFKNADGDYQLDEPDGADF